LAAALLELLWATLETLLPATLEPLLAPALKLLLPRSKLSLLRTALRRRLLAGSWWQVDRTDFLAGLRRSFLR
jgi:hypothetical protein